MRKLRIYADTSVFGGCFDDEFSDDSKSFFQEINDGRFILVVSSTTLRELDKVPDFVQKILAEIQPNSIELLEFSDEVSLLRDEYIKESVLSISCKADVEHVAHFTIAGVDFIVSWNFKHIVHYDKINGLQTVNLLNGYKPIKIYSPKEVIDQ